MQCPKLSELPPPPPGKTGWPWTEETERLPNTMPDGGEWPRISIVTPNYNYGQFIEETIRSVLLQGYPNLEYIVIDGGSTDDSVEIIKKYEPWLSYWVSEKDRGQANAINKGISIATGEWFNWLNSDDILLNNALFLLVHVSSYCQQATWVSGARLEMNQYSWFSEVCVPWRYNPNVIGLNLPDFPQDATFIKTDFLRENNLSLSEDISCVFDTILHLEMLQYSKPLLTTVFFSAMRWHDNQKTGSPNGKKEAEYLSIRIKQHSHLIIRVILRLQATRFHKLIKLLLMLMISYNFSSRSNEWMCVAFDRFADNKYKLIRANLCTLW